MSKHPLEFMKENDEELFSNIDATRALAFQEGEIPLKDKLLIALAIDASHGAENGIKSLGKKALEAGATKEEMMEVLRIAYYISGVGCIYASARALEELF